METELKKTLNEGNFGEVNELVSAKMKAIISSGTKPELRLRELTNDILLNELLLEYNSNLPGKPDIFIPKLSLVIFCDGCFFHFCPKHGHIPQKNSNYWQKKFELNVRRDRRINYKLRRMGYRIWRIWEHHLSSENAIQKIRQILINRFKNMSELSA